MANLSERLWKLAAMSPKTFDLLAHSSAMRSQFYTTTAEAAEVFDRLTVEGLARAMCIADGTDPDEHVRGGQAQSFEDFGPRWQAEGVGADYKRLAQALLTYITTPSVEESQALAALSDTPSVEKQA